MNRKTKKLSQKLFYVLLILLTINSCQKESDDSDSQNLIDDNPVSNEYQNRGLDFKVSGYSDFQNDSNFNSLINGLSLSDRFTGNNTANRTGDNSVYGFTIDTTEIRQVQFDGYTSYTFKVFRGEQSVGLFENLVVEVSEGEERAYIASYIPDQQYLDDISNGIITEFNGTVRIENINSDTSNRNNNIGNRSSSCGSYYVIVETQCPCAGHWPGQSCECSSGPSTMRYSFDYPCDDGGGFTEGPIGPRGGGGGDGTPSSGDSATAPVGIQNNENPCDPAPEGDMNGNCMLEYFEICLGGMDRNVLASFSNEDIEALGNYINSVDNCSESTQAFVIFASEALEEGFHESTMDDLFEILEIEQDYRNQMSQSERNIFDGLDRKIQLQYLQSAYNATVMSEDLYPNTSSTPCNLYNGIGDAYRHTLWNALSTVRIGAPLTEQLTTAHEDRPAPIGYTNHNKENQMDLFNNSAGRQIAFGSGLVTEMVQTALENGDLRYLTNLDSSNTIFRCRATNSSTLTPTH